MSSPAAAWALLVSLRSAVAAPISSPAPCVRRSRPTIPPSRARRSAPGRRARCLGRRAHRPERHAEPASATHRRDARPHWRARAGADAEGSILINTVRAGIVDEMALAEARAAVRRRRRATSSSRSGHSSIIRCCARRTSSLAPHLGGATEETLDRVGLLVVEQALEVLAGQPREPVFSTCTGNCRRYAHCVQDANSPADWGSKDML